MVIKTISIREDQAEWIKIQKEFNFSKFIQFELDEYIKLREKFKEFMKDEKTIE